MMSEKVAICQMRLCVNCFINSEHIEAETKWSAFRKKISNAFASTKTLRLNIITVPSLLLGVPFTNMDQLKSQHE